jgi:hypothetical protein
MWQSHTAKNKNLFAALQQQKRGEKKIEKLFD